MRCKAGLMENFFFFLPNSISALFCPHFQPKSASYTNDFGVKRLQFYGFRGVHRGVAIIIIASVGLGLCY
jgi:hypothetical protein